jgi:Zn-dependent peptidase ImmA (M78 family)/DNA-binding XRE family transcriptional regulator
MPPKARVRANVRPEILVWARETAGFLIEEAARKIAVRPERVIAWESGEAQPTIPQLRKMSQVYRRPLGVFYLPEVPKGFQVMRDYRRLPGDGIRRFSADLTLEMRAAQERRELMLDLLEEIDEAPPVFRFAATMEEPPEALGLRIREFLGITRQLQATWRDPRIAFKAWRNRMENAGVLVLQMARVETEVVSGFAIAHDRLPVVAVNKRDPWARRGFSLLHEFTHLALRASGVSDLDVDAQRPPEDQSVEVFCNAVAAAALMPRDDFLTEPLVAERPVASREWDDSTILELSRTFSVSREAVVRRLVTFGRASEAFYRRKRAQYAAELEQQRAREREQLEGQEFRRNPARESVMINGEPFARAVLNSFYRERITLSEALTFLGVRVRHLPRIERALGIG